MIEIEFPTTEDGAPAKLSARSIGRIAARLRKAVGPDLRGPVPVEVLVARVDRLAVNGAELRVAWDVSGDVRDDDGKSVLGACMNDPAEPGMVMIYVNGALLAERPEVMRSTAAHELAHAIFDMPAALGRDTVRAFRTTTEQMRAEPGLPIDWPEWRADQFMGEFLVPEERLARLLVREAGVLDLRVGWREDRWGRTLPFVDTSPRAERVGWLVDHLSESFGVTAPFMTTRLRRGAFIGRPASLGVKQ